MSGVSAASAFRFDVRDVFRLTGTRMRKDSIDITGRVFGLLTVLSFSGRVVTVRCACGTVKEVEKWNLIERTRSCGKLPCKPTKLKGESKTRTYSIYRGMLQRCLNPNHESYSLYGGRGIMICERWLAGYEFFLEDMGDAPLGLQLERVDNNGHYSPENCRWATPAEQMINTRRNVRVAIGGVSRTVSQWAETNGINRSTAYKRINRSHWNPADAVTRRVA